MFSIPNHTSIVFTHTHLRIYVSTTNHHIPISIYLNFNILDLIITMKKYLCCITKPFLEISNNQSKARCIFYLNGSV